MKKIMNEIPELCKGCGQGTRIGETITDYPNGGHEEIYYYSCSHRNFLIETPPVTRIVTYEVRSKLKSGNRVGRSFEQEIFNRCDNSDRDQPDRPVTNTIYRQRTPDHTAVFQAVMYDSGELKHLHCKRCNNNWMSSMRDPLSNQFVVEIGEKIHILCLQCQDSFTRPQ